MCNFESINFHIENFLNIADWIKKTIVGHKLDQRQ
jgi:hypothetical protein